MRTASTSSACRSSLWLAPAPAASAVESLAYERQPLLAESVRKPPEHRDQAEREPGCSGRRCTRWCTRRLQRCWSPAWAPRGGVCRRGGRAAVSRGEPLGGGVARRRGGGERVAHAVDAGAAHRRRGGRNARAVPPTPPAPLAPVPRAARTPPVKRTSIFICIVDKNCLHRALTRSGEPLRVASVLMAGWGVWMGSLTHLPSG